MDNRYVESTNICLYLCMNTPRLPSRGILIKGASHAPLGF